MKENTIEKKGFRRILFVETCPNFSTNTLKILLIFLMKNGADLQWNLKTIFYCNYFWFVSNLLKFVFHFFFWFHISCDCIYALFCRLLSENHTKITLLFFFLNFDMNNLSKFLRKSSRFVVTFFFSISR